MGSRSRTQRSQKGLRLAGQAIEAGKDDPDVLWMAGDATFYTCWRARYGGKPPSTVP